MYLSSFRLPITLQGHLEAGADEEGTVQGSYGSVGALGVSMVSSTQSFLSPQNISGNMTLPLLESKRYRCENIFNLNG